MAGAACLRALDSLPCLLPPKPCAWTPGPTHLPIIAPPPPPRSLTPSCPDPSSSPSFSTASDSERSSGLPLPKTNTPPPWGLSLHLKLPLHLCPGLQWPNVLVCAPSSLPTHPSPRPSPASHPHYHAEASDTGTRAPPWPPGEDSHRFSTTSTCAGATSPRAGNPRHLTLNLRSPVCFHGTCSFVCRPSATIHTLVVRALDFQPLNLSQAPSEYF